MDPVSLTASILTLIEGASTIYRLIHSVRGADKEFAALCVELGTLADFLKAIKTAHEDFSQHPLALVSIGQDLWTQCRNALMDCQETLDELDQLVKRMKAPGRSNTVFRRTKLATEMRMHSQAIVSFRDRIRISIVSLQTMLQVINVSFSLQHSASQSATLHELQKLNRHLEGSKNTAASQSTNHLNGASRDVFKHAKELIRAARTFHDDASSNAGGSLGTCASDRFPNPNGTNTHYAESGILSKNPSVKRERIELYLMDREQATEGVTPSIPELPTNRECWPNSKPSARFDVEFHAKCSKGLTSLAQKAIDKLDFLKAEELLRQALKYYRVSGLHDRQHKKLRTQLALCSFLQYKGNAEGALILDMAEFAAENDVVTRQLLYALALEQLHELDLKATNEVCRILWGICQRSGGRESPTQNDIWRLIALSQRESGSQHLADAIDEMEPDLDMQGSLPSAIQFIVTCKELLLELFGDPHDTESQRVLGILVQTLPEATSISAFQKRQLDRRATNDSDLHADSNSPTSSDQEADDEGSAGSGQASRENRPHKETRRQRRLKRHTEEFGHKPVSTSISSTGTVRFQALRKVMRRVERTFSHNKDQSDKSGFSAKAISLKGLTARRHGSKAFHVPRAPKSREGPDDVTITLPAPRRPQEAADHGSLEYGTALARSFSFGPTTCSAEWIMTRQELPDTTLFEMMDTSPRVELADTGLVEADNVNVSSSSSRWSDLIETSRGYPVVRASVFYEKEDGGVGMVFEQGNDMHPSCLTPGHLPCAKRPRDHEETTVSALSPTEERSLDKTELSQTTYLTNGKEAGWGYGEISAVSESMECRSSPRRQPTQLSVSDHDIALQRMPEGGYHHDSGTTNLEMWPTIHFNAATNDEPAADFPRHHSDQQSADSSSTSSGLPLTSIQSLGNTDADMSYHSDGIGYTPYSQPPQNSISFEPAIADSGYDSGESDGTRRGKRRRTVSTDAQADDECRGTLLPQKKPFFSTPLALSIGMMLPKRLKGRQKFLKHHEITAPEIRPVGLDPGPRQTGPTYVYLGPNAVTGPYTMPEEAVLEFDRPGHGVPEHPQEPGDILAPIELDTHVPVRARSEITHAFSV